MSVSLSLPSGVRARPRAFRRLGYQKDVVLHLVRLELATRHRGSLLGWLWTLIPPLLQLAVTHFLFTRIIPLNVENYPVFLLTGILAWNLFSRALGSATISLESRRDLVLRPGFATGLLPLSAVLVGLVDYLLAAPILFIALAATTGLHVEALLLPLLLAVQLLLTLGLGLLLAPLQVFFRDVRQVVGILLTLGFWITPVFYRRAQVPDSLSFVYDLNPMGQLIEAQRRLLLEGELPSASATGLVALAAVATLAAGAAVFAGLRHSVPEQL